MDAGVWSHADIRNGRRLFIALAAIVLVQQAFGLICIASGIPLTTLGDAGRPFAGLPELPRQSAILLIMATRGHAWARLSFGLVALLAALATAFRSLPVSALLWRAGEAQGMHLQALALFGASVLAILASLALMILPPLRAYTWHRATARDAIPVPRDDEPVSRRTLRRLPTFGERLVALAQAFANGVMIAVILVLWAVLAGFGGWFERFLEP